MNVSVIAHPCPCCHGFSLVDKRWNQSFNMLKPVPNSLYLFIYFYFYVLMIEYGPKCEII